MRSYISSLVDHLEKDQDQSGPLDFSQPQSRIKPTRAPPGTRHHFAFSQGTYRYLETGSLLLEISVQSERPQKLQYPNFPPHAITEDGTITPELRRFLLQVFFKSIHPIYPILNPSLPWLSPDAVLDVDPSPTQSFVVQMVCAIACHCAGEHALALIPLAADAHARALKHIDKATAEPSISALQVVVLLILYTLFDPKSGNISQQLGFAVRLAIDLAGSDNYDQPSALLTLHKIIYCLENQVCSVLVRPTSLPEPPTAPSSSLVEEPLDFMCTLYHMQSRARKRAADDDLESLLALDDGKLQLLHPNVRATLWETRLMLQTSTSAASRLIATYSEDEYIVTFLTAHWTHKAAKIIIDSVSTSEGQARPENMLAYGRATGLLGKWSASWESASILLDSLHSRLQVDSRVVEDGAS